MMELQTGGPNGTLGSEFTRTYYRYNTNEGIKGSTTRNIYGIYDMAGGSWEYMASFLSNGTSSPATTMLGKSDAEKSYMEMYAGTGETSSTTDRQANYDANSQKYGDAVYETSSHWNSSSGSWNKDFSHFPYLTGPFFVRGGYYHHSTYAGVFAFLSSTGGGYVSSGFRAVAL